MTSGKKLIVERINTTGVLYSTALLITKNTMMVNKCDTVDTKQ